MTITSNDIKLFQAQDNTDNDSGGGSRTSTEIVDGAVNNLFADISRIDTVSGDVALIKIFPTVTTNNQDVYYGAHTMVRKTPTDPKVSALIFHTDDPNDTRIQAQDKIESYVVASYREEFWLYGKHVVGAKSVTFLQLVESQIPDVGGVYLLKEGDTEQYVRVAQIEEQIINLSYSWGGDPINYTRRRIICEIEQPLEYAFTGSAFHPIGQLPDTADTWATQIADAANFYSTKTLSENALTDDVKIKVDSIYEQLVPASKKQTPIINKYALVQGTSLIPTGNLYSYYHTGLLNGGVALQLPHPVTPNSVTRVYNTNYHDDGLGNIIDTVNNNAIVGSVDYKLGLIILVNSASRFYVDYEIANTFDSDIQFTNEIKITQENVGYVFTQRLSPMPSVGDLYIDYRSQGKWYRFASTNNRTGGNETLGGNSDIGGGSLNDNTDGTGTVSLTLGSLPDIDSSIIISWGSAEKITSRTAFIAKETECAMHFALNQTNIDPLSFVMQIYSPGHGGVKNVTALADGTLVDEVSKIKGSLDFLNGNVVINSVDSFDNRFPALAGQDVIIDFNYSDAGSGDTGGIKALFATATPVGDDIGFTSENNEAGTFTFDMGGAVTRESLMLSFEYYKKGDYTKSKIVLECDGSGVLRRYGRHFSDTSTYGSVSALGVVTVQMQSYDYKIISPIYTGNFFPQPRYTTETTSYAKVSGKVTIDYQTESPLTFSLSHNITDNYENISTYNIKTLPNIAGEVGFNFPSSSIPLYSKSGIVFEEDGTEIGVIDYEKGEIVLDCFNKPDVLSIEFTKLFTDDIGEENDKVKNFTFRTAATKLTTSSFQVSYETANGNFIATTNSNGVVTGTDVDSGESYVDTQTGMANIVFTEQAVPSSIKYDAVAESSLPLDPELLGLNPVRLPADGRVPVFKAGYHLIIFNEVTTATSNATPLANDVETLARSGQAFIEVIDTNGKRLDPLQYTADRAAGTVTFSPTLVLEDKYNQALTAPFYIVDRVEDMVLATDVQINGLISLSAGLSRDYTLGITKVASALVWGDTGARAYNLFAQEIWDNGNPVWSDERIGDNTTAQYNIVDNPIQIVNESATAGRWAIIFKSSNTVDVVHEKLGIMQSGVSILVDDVAPINPATGNPYFTMYKEGFGAGWSTNNVIRFNTDSGDNNMWVIRTVKSGALSELTDSIDIEVRGDAN